MDVSIESVSYKTLDKYLLVNIHASTIVFDEGKILVVYYDGEQIFKKNLEEGVSINLNFFHRV